jgi:hypothetical protein
VAQHRGATHLGEESQREGEVVCESGAVSDRSVQPPKCPRPPVMKVTAEYCRFRYDLVRFTLDLLKPKETPTTLTN